MCGLHPRAGQHPQGPRPISGNSRECPVCGGSLHPDPPRAPHLARGDRHTLHTRRVDRWTRNSHRTARAGSRRWSERPRHASAGNSREYPAGGDTELGALADVAPEVDARLQPRREPVRAAPLGYPRPHLEPPTRRTRVVRGPRPRTRGRAIARSRGGAGGYTRVPWGREAFGPSPSPCRPGSKDSKPFPVMPPSQESCQALSRRHSRRCGFVPPRCRLGHSRTRPSPGHGFEPA